MGKKAKSIMKAVTNAPATFVDAAKGTASAALGAGKALVGGGGGNYLQGLKSASEQVLMAGANNVAVGMTGGMTSLSEKAPNNLDAQAAKVLGKSGDNGVTVPADVDVGTVAEDPALAAERENAKRKGKASNILGGSSDSLSNVSAKKSLLAL